jgi:hypothetical protein
MKRIKLAAISTAAAAMILGSSLVFAASPSSQTGETGADAPSIATDLAADPVRRGAGGGGFHLKK